MDNVFSNSIPTKLDDHGHIGYILSCPYGPVGMYFRTGGLDFTSGGYVLNSLLSRIEESEKLVKLQLTK